jgi:hypothetical protein
VSFVGSAPDKGRLGRFVITVVGDETVGVFVPPPLPPTPPVAFPRLMSLLQQAEFSRSSGK